MKSLNVKKDDIRFEMTNEQLIKTIKDLKNMLKFAKLEYKIRNY